MEPQSLSIRKAKSFLNMLLEAPSAPDHLSLTKARSVYRSPSPSRKAYAMTVAPVKKEEQKEPPLFLIQSIGEEVTAATKSEAFNSLRRNSRSKSLASRRSSYISTELKDIIQRSNEDLSSQDLEKSVGKSKEELRKAKRRLSKYGSMESSAILQASRGQRGIEEACRGLIAVEDYYKKEYAYEEGVRAWYENRIR